MPTPTPAPVDNILGLWETYYKSTYGCYVFFENETLYYNEGGFSTTGTWKKIDDRHYTVNLGKGGDVPLILNDDLTRFDLEGDLTFIKNPDPSATPVPPKVEKIIGYWEESRNSVYYYIHFYGDGTLEYYKGGNVATGRWEKINDSSYKLTIFNSVTVITLDSSFTQFNYGPENIVLVKTDKIPPL